jgi:hypothetical protein
MNVGCCTRVAVLHSKADVLKGSLHPSAVYSFSNRLNPDLVLSLQDLPRQTGLFLHRQLVP